MPQLVCPGCILRPAIARRVHAGDRLFPAWNSRKALQALRTFGEANGRKDAGRMGTHSLGRGAARAILEAGNSLAQLLRSGHWRSSAFQLYLDFRREESRAMASILIDASDDEN